MYVHAYTHTHIHTSNTYIHTYMHAYIESSNYSYRRRCSWSFSIAIYTVFGTTVGKHRSRWDTKRSKACGCADRLAASGVINKEV